MRNIVLFLQFVLIPACMVGQPITALDKLAGYFPFTNCDTIDASGGASSAIWDKQQVLCGCGVNGQSLVFNDDNDSVMFVGDVAKVFTTTNFTVSFYIKPEDLNPSQAGAGATQMVMSKQEDCTSDKAFWVRYRNKGQNSNTSNIISAGISQSDSLKAVVTAKLDDDRCWYHIVISRDGGDFRIFVDGIERDKASTATRLDITNNASFSLSVPKCAQTDAHFKGELDELRFYNRAYTEESEIRKLLALNPDKIVNSDTLIYLGSAFTAQISATCADNFVWSPAGGVSNLYAANTDLSPDGPTQYILRFQYPDGCAAYDTLFVDVIDPDTLNCNEIFIPNAFTPGLSAGKNDIFGISNPFAIPDFISFEIFDRWGGRVFSGMSVTDTWDGNFGGQPVNPGIFLYRLRFNCQGEEKVLSGTVTVLR